MCVPHMCVCVSETSQPDMSGVRMTRSQAGGRPSQPGHFVEPSPSTGRQLPAHDTCTVMSPGAQVLPGLLSGRKRRNGITNLTGTKKVRTGWSKSRCFSPRKRWCDRRPAEAKLCRGELGLWLQGSQNHAPGSPGAGAVQEVSLGIHWVQVPWEEPASGSFGAWLLEKDQGGRGARAVLRPPYGSAATPSIFSVPRSLTLTVTQVGSRTGLQSSEP